MESLVIKRIEDLHSENILTLIQESKENGFRFLQRLMDDYTSGVNTFSQPGEALYGVYNPAKELIAIGGINREPYTTTERIGRLRRFYVQKAYRRNGVGRLLVNHIIQEASPNFDIIGLKTDTDQADFFYQALGFIKETKYINTTHYKVLKDKEFLK